MATITKLGTPLAAISITKTCGAYGANDLQRLIEVLNEKGVELHSVFYLSEKTTLMVEDKAVRMAIKLLRAGIEGSTSYPIKSGLGRLSLDLNGGIVNSQILMALVVSLLDNCGIDVLGIMTQKNTVALFLYYTDLDKAARILNHVCLSDELMVSRDPQLIPPEGICD